MGGKRAPFHINSRKRSPFWQFSASIDGREIRESLEARVADDPNKRKAGPEASARYLQHCARLGAKAEVGIVETDTLRLLNLYVDSELAARARKRGPTYANTEETRIVRHVVPRFPLVDSKAEAFTSGTEAKVSGKCAKLPPSTYFVGCEESPLVKIGWASDPTVRLGCLQTGSPVGLRLLSILPGPRRIEKELHLRFKALRAHGEWFLCAPGNELHVFIETQTHDPETLTAMSPAQF